MLPVPNLARGRQYAGMHDFAESRTIRLTNAGVAQLVECQLPKLNVAGSNPVARSRIA